ncbi:hypothetical protein Vafri_21789, partial [Volvox africanus]
MTVYFPTVPLTNILGLGLPLVALREGYTAMGFTLSVSLWHTPKLCSHGFHTGSPSKSLYSPGVPYAPPRKYFALGFPLVPSKLFSHRFHMCTPSKSCSARCPSVTPSKLCTAPGLFPSSSPLKLCTALGREEVRVSIPTPVLDIEAKEDVCRLPSKVRASIRNCVHLFSLTSWGSWDGGRYLFLTNALKGKAKEWLDDWAMHRW